MSLINDMLRDLDKRAAASRTAANPAKGLSAAQGKKNNIFVMIAVGLGAMLLAIGGTLFMYPENIPPQAKAIFNDIFNGESEPQTPSVEQLLKQQQAAQLAQKKASSAPSPSDSKAEPEPESSPAENIMAKVAIKAAEWLVTEHDKELLADFKLQLDGELTKDLQIVSDEKNPQKMTLLIPGSEWKTKIPANIFNNPLIKQFRVRENSEDERLEVDFEFKLPVEMDLKPVAGEGGVPGWIMLALKAIKPISDSAMLASAGSAQNKKTDAPAQAAMATKPQEAPEQTMPKPMQPEPPSMSPPAPETVAKASAPMLPPPQSSKPARESKPVKKLMYRSQQQAAESAYRQGVIALEEGRVDEAVENLKQALLMKPSMHSARETLLGLLIDMGEFNWAYSMVDEGLLIAPSYVPFSKLKARLLYATGDNVGAISILEGAQAGILFDAELFAMLGAIYQQQGMHEQAMKAYDRLVRRQDDNAIYWMGLAISLDHLAMANDAMAAYQRALSIGELDDVSEAYVKQRMAELR